MRIPDSLSDTAVSAISNGSGAAAMLAAAIGGFVLALLAIAGDKSISIKNSLIFYKPTGALSGVTTLAIVIWLLTWGILEWRWSKRTVSMARINAVSLIVLALSILLTFPPIVDFI